VLFSLAFNRVDLTHYIPNQLRSVFFRNALKLSLLEKGIPYKFELDARERQLVNSILSQTGAIISELINIPGLILEHLKFSEVISSQLYYIYQTQVPKVLKSALERAHVEQTLV